MWIFKSARIRLTAWYVLIVAFISLSFSFIIYRYVSFHLETGFRSVEARVRGNSGARVGLIYLADELTSAKKNFLFRLLFVDGIIILGAGLGAYFLARKTLDPIEEIVEGQKRFIADASHELKTPLTTLKSEIEVALRDPKMTLSESKNYLKSNLEETNKLGSLVEHMLSLNRLENIGSNIVKKNIRLDLIAREIGEVYKKRAQKKKLRFEIKTNIVNLKADETSLRQLVGILLDNAVKYTQKGKVEVKVYKKSGKAHIEVNDTGIGMARSVLTRIFDRFYRADSSRSKNNTEGYGLGLSIAKSIVEAHSGQIKVTSSKKGSRFTVIL